MKVDSVGINAYKILPRTKKFDMTPIRLEGDDDNEDGDGDDSDKDKDEDEESTPVPRSKRHVARCVFLLRCHSIPWEASTFTYPAFHSRSVRKTTTTNSVPMKPKSRQREVDKAQDDEDDEDGSGAQTARDITKPRSGVD